MKFFRPCLPGQSQGNLRGLSEALDKGAWTETRRPLATRCYPGMVMLRKCCGNVPPLDNKTRQAKGFMNPGLMSISPALQPNSKRTICDWQRLGPAAWISDRVLPTWFPESINRPHIRAGVLKISRGTDNVKSSCTHRQSTRKRTCANLLTIVPTVIAAQ